MSHSTEVLVGTERSGNAAAASFLAFKAALTAADALASANAVGLGVCPHAYLNVHFWLSLDRCWDFVNDRTDTYLPLFPLRFAHYGVIALLYLFSMTSALRHSRTVGSVVVHCVPGVKTSGRRRHVLINIDATPSLSASTLIIQHNVLSE
jgi:hypothetical protein